MAKAKAKKNTQLQDYAQQENSAHEAAVCPHCGYCPHCKRAAPEPVPVVPFWYWTHPTPFMPMLDQKIWCDGIVPGTTGVVSFFTL